MLEPDSMSGAPCQLVVDSPCPPKQVEARQEQLIKQDNDKLKVAPAMTSIMTCSEASQAPSIPKQSEEQTGFGLRHA
jgi:hypothetical protein